LSVPILPTRTQPLSLYQGPACQPDRPFSRSPSLTGGSCLSDPSPPNRPYTAYASTWNPRPRRTLRPRMSPPQPIYNRLAPARPPLPSFAHSQPIAPTSRRAHAQGARPLFTVSAHLFCSRRRASVVLIAPVSSASSPATQDTPWFALTPSIPLCSRSPGSCHAAVSPPPSTRVPVVFSSSLKRSRAVSQGNPPPRAPNFPFPALLFAQLLAVVG
jgi:hypothetical protein